MISHVVAQRGKDGSVKPFYLYVSLRMVRGSEHVLDTKYGAYAHAELGDKMASVIGQQMDRWAVHEYPMGNEGRSHCGNRDLLGRNCTKHLRISIGDNQEKAVTAAGSKKFTKDINRDIFQGCLGCE